MIPSKLKSADTYLKVKQDYLGLTAYIAITLVTQCDMWLSKDNNLVAFKVWCKFHKQSYAIGTLHCNFHSHNLVQYARYKAQCRENFGSMQFRKLILKKKWTFMQLTRCHNAIKCNWFHKFSQFSHVEAYPDFKSYSATTLKTITNCWQ